MSNFFDMDPNAGLEAFEKKAKTNDGILKFDVKNIPNGKKSIRVVMRFLQNLTQEGTAGSNCIEKKVHYVKLPNNKDLNGYYDSMSNFKGEKCLLTNTYWELKNSSSVVEQEKAELISRTTKWYSYVQILEHDADPTLVGKIMVFPFGIKVKNKIENEKTGEITGTQVNIYNMAEGKDFICIVKEVGGFANYDDSTFKPNVSALKIPTADGTFKEVPTYEDANGIRRIDPKAQQKVRDYLLVRDVELETFTPVRWDDETRLKVESIVNVLKNNAISNVNDRISNLKKGDDDFFNTIEDDASTNTSSKSTIDEDDFFN